MSERWVIHYYDKHYIGYTLERGRARETVIAKIMGGHCDGHIDCIDNYDTEEGWARDVSEDIAREIARRVVEIGDPPSTQVRDFIETQLGVGTAIPAAA